MKLLWIKPFNSHSTLKLAEFPNRTSFMMSFDEVNDRDELVEFLSPMVATTMMVVGDGGLALVDIDTPQEVLVFKLQYSEFFK